MPLNQFLFRVFGFFAHRNFGNSLLFSFRNKSSQDQHRFFSILGLDRMAGCIAVVSEAITNNGWLAIGIIGSSFAAALAGGRFKLSKLTFKNSIASLIGGVLLGWGSMTALGCTIGVLLSGTQAFALSGWVFFLFSFLGVWLGIKAKLHKI